MHLNKGRIQVKPKKVSTLQRRSKFAFAKVLATCLSNICTIRDLNFAKVRLAGDTIGIQCVFMLHKILNFFAPRIHPT
jgi:hypothetical protein